MKTKQKSAATLGASFVVLSSLFYASYGIWTTLMGNFFGGNTASALRSILVLLILIPIALAYRQFKPMGWRRNWPYLLGLVVSAVLIWGPLYYAILTAGVGISLAINYACIVIGMFFFGWLLTGEKFTKEKIMSALLGLTGLALVFAPSVSSIGWLALIGAAVSGLSGALHYVIAKKLSYSATQSTICIWTASTLAGVPAALVMGESLPAIGWHIEWLYLGLFALSSVLASWLLVNGIKRIDAGAAGILGLLEIVFGVIFGVIFFYERPGFVVLMGVVIIIVAAALPYANNFKLKKPRVV